MAEIKNSGPSGGKGGGVGNEEKELGGGGGPRDPDQGTARAICERFSHITEITIGRE